MFGTLDTVATHDNIEKIYRAMKAAVEDNFKEYGVRFISHSSHWYDWGAMNYSRFIIDNPPKTPRKPSACTIRSGTAASARRWPTAAC